MDEKMKFIVKLIEGEKWLYFADSSVFPEKRIIK